jgi:serine/threonine protein kinase
MLDEAKRIEELEAYIGKLERIVQLERKLRSELTARTSAPKSNATLAEVFSSLPTHAADSQGNASFSTQPGPRRPSTQNGFTPEESVNVNAPTKSSDPFGKVKLETPMSERTIVVNSRGSGSTSEAVRTQIFSRRPNEAPTNELQPAALASGYTLHEYRIERLLGRGGFGLTYLAIDINLNTKVAIKEYLPEQFARRLDGAKVAPRTEEDGELYYSWLDSFLEEARTLATFRHPNVMKVSRFFEANATAYMVLEYERGTPLKEWWSNNRNLPEAELVALIQPLFDGLAHVHSSGYLHRDIKPENIYVRSDDGSLVLLDFGSARRTGPAGPDQDIVYTPGFAPAEQYSGGEQGPWTDVYAIGATLYWMVTGEKPVSAPDRLAKITTMPTAVEAGAGRYGDAFLQAIDWALEPEKEARAPNVPALCSALFADHAGALRLQEALQDSLPDVGEGKESNLPLKLRLSRRWQAVRKGALHPSSWSMGAKIGLSMVLAALLPMLITAYYNLNGGLATASTNELRSLEALATSTAEKVGVLLGDSRKLAAYLGDDEDFLHFLSEPTDDAREKIITKLMTLIKANSDVRSVQVINAQGFAVASTIPSVIGADYRFRDYYKATMEGKVHISGLMAGALIPEPGMFFSHPVYNGNRSEIVGLVSMRINGKAIAGLVDSANDQNGRTAFLMDGDGVLVHHADPKWHYSSLRPLSHQKLQEIDSDKRYGKKGITNLFMPELVDSVLSNNISGNIRYSSAISKHEEIAGYARVPNTNMRVVVSEPLSSFEEPLNRLFSNVLYSVSMVGMVFMLFAITLSRNLVRPIVQLTQAALALKSGDFEAAHIKVTTSDEIGRLARTFNVMCDVLRQRERERERGSARNRLLANGSNVDL